MRRIILALALTLALPLVALPVASAAAPERAPLRRAPGEAVEGSYVVVLDGGGDPAGVAAALGAAPERVYEHTLRGFAAELDAEALERVRRHPQVAYVEEDQVLTASAVQWFPPWGLDRIDQRYLPLDNQYRYNATGSGVNVYVFDTGIDYGHWDFGGRARFAYDAFGGDGSDCHGHGTHVAGIAGGAYYGVAKESTLWSMRVLNCWGGGTLSGIITATDWLAANHRKPAVANYSLGGGYSEALNTAVDNLSASGVFVTAAAGGSASDACDYSPGGADGSYTVASSDKTDQVASSSSFGPCVRIYAPGVSIPSAWLNGGSATLSGTSMAAPHVVGVAALYKSYGDAPSALVAGWLSANGTAGVLIGVPPGTPNLLLYKSSL